MSGLGPPSGGAECRVCNLQAAPLHQVHTIKATRKYSADVHCCRGPQKFWIVHALDRYIGVFISISLFPAIMGVILTQLDDAGGGTLAIRGIVASAAAAGDILTGQQ